ncbi:MAG: hypothetical protein U0694_15670 [Anaerolineae bacterium]
MVGHNHVESRSFAVFHLVDGTNATVNRDDQLDSGGGQFAQRVAV